MPTKSIKHLILISNYVISGSNYIQGHPQGGKVGAFTHSWVFDLTLCSFT